MDGWMDGWTDGRTDGRMDDRNVNEHECAYGSTIETIWTGDKPRQTDYDRSGSALE